MSLADQVNALATRIAQEFNALGPAGGQTYRAAQVRNSTAPNVNTTAWTVCAIGGVVDEAHADFTVASNGIVCNFDGIVRATAMVKQNASSARTNVKIRLAVGGVANPVESCSSYIRNATGHNESSTSIPGLRMAVTDGDLVTVETIREAGAGTVTMIAGKSYLLLERWA